jgi:hypothetical protein
MYASLAILQSVKHALELRPSALHALKHFFYYQKSVFALLLVQHKQKLWLQSGLLANHVLQSVSHALASLMHV